MRHLLFLLLTFTSAFQIKAQLFYDIGNIQKIEITFSQSNWDYILDTAKQGSDSYTLAQNVTINGLQFDSVGVKYKGNSSYNPLNAKNPLHIELDHFKEQDYQGFKDIKLSNGYHEPSMVREVLAYNILQNYTKISRANFAQVYINGQYSGVYTNVEAVTNTFLENRFYSDNNTFVFADNGGCNLRFKGPDSTFYFTPYTMKSDYGWKNLADFCDTLRNNITGIENILDEDRALWMLAATNSMVILDSYLGSSTHNYYLYKDHNGVFNPIIWDLNGGFGVFNKLNPGVPGLTTSQMQTMPVMAHGNDTMWPLIKALFSVPTYRRMYIAHMRTIVNENFLNNSYYTSAQYFQSVIDTAFQSDPNNFYTYQEFAGNIDCTVVDGPKIIPGISELMSGRIAYLTSTTEFQQAPPVISNVTSSDTFPVIGSQVYITAQISNGSTVLCGFRKSVMDPFVRVMMYDNGTNGDGAAGDGVYGTSIIADAPQLQYYIYAENNSAGMFSPERAEHEFHVLNTDYATISAGQLVINELMAMNSGAVTNANGKSSDWIELFNNSTSSLTLDHLNLSDDPLNTSKWTFPTGTTLGPNQFLIVWADEDTSSVELHANFKLSGTGEKLFLSYENGMMIDSLTFPAQSSNISFGRYPNGTGPFVTMPYTFNTFNSLVGIKEITENFIVSVFPNPASDNITVTIPATAHGNYKFEIFDVAGKSVYSVKLNSAAETMRPDLTDGIYFYRISENNICKATGKLTIQN